MRPKPKNNKEQANVEEQQPQHVIKEEKPISDKYQVKYNSKTQLRLDEKESFVLGVPGTKIYSVKWDAEDKYIACACENGTVRIFNVRKRQLSYLINSLVPNVPFSYVKWRPQAQQFKTRNIFVTGNTKGEVQHWHMTSGKCLGTMKEDNSDIYCIDYNQDATKLAVCGLNPIIRIHDEEKRVVDVRLGVEQTQPPGHNNRVYCVKFHPQNPNMLISGGWDYRVLIWDIRQKKPEANQIYGPLICGDGIDMRESFDGQQLLTASWSQEKQLQTWDLRTCKLICNFDWNSQIKVSNQPCQLYSGQFSRQFDNQLTLAGGSGENEVRIFDSQDFDNAQICIHDLCREVNTVDWAHKDSRFAFSGGDGYLRIFEIQQIN
ncbi:unnamed protein product [Paramecium octaurelia]|uniref:Uncharacterized protein n=1 Tax=Paramecium octaurelia TaxID=43137 RepID=A0A8S1STI2_PAROT|nr:unnamed protein product [Paramecium octaurelia]